MALPISVLSFYVRYHLFLYTIFKKKKNYYQFFSKILCLKENFISLNCEFYFFYQFYFKSTTKKKNQGTGKVGGDPSRMILGRLATAGCIVRCRYNQPNI